MVVNSLEDDLCLYDFPVVFPHVSLVNSICIVPPWISIGFLVPRHGGGAGDRGVPCPGRGTPLDKDSDIPVINTPFISNLLLVNGLLTIVVCL